MNERAGALTEYIRELHVAVGRPSSRSLRDKIRAEGVLLSHTTVNDIIRGIRVAGWQAIQAVVWALDGDMEHAHALWSQAYQEGRGATADGVYVSAAQARHLELVERLERVEKLLLGLSPAETEH